MTKSSDREIGEIHAKVDEIHKKLMGNGQPGLIQDFGTMNSRIDRYDGAMGFVKWFVSIFGVFTIGTLIAVVKLYIS